MLRSSLRAPAATTSRFAPATMSPVFPATVLSSTLCEQHRHASKASGTTTKYQARPSRDKDIGFKIFLGKPIRKNDVLLRQRHRYDHNLGVREPDYHAGRNVKMDKKLYTLTAERDGVPTLRDSNIDPTYQWLDIEPDIQKVYRTTHLRDYHHSRGSASRMSATHNNNYQPEEADLKEPDWRQRVMRKMPLRERFPDPNLLTRGVVDSIAPKPKYFYE